MNSLRIRSHLANIRFPTLLGQFKDRLGHSRGEIELAFQNYGYILNYTMTFSSPWQSSNTLNGELFVCLQLIAGASFPGGG